MPVPIVYDFTVRKYNWFPIPSHIRKAGLQLK